MLIRSLKKIGQVLAVPALMILTSQGLVQAQNCPLQQAAMAKAQQSCPSQQAALTMPVSLLTPVAEQDIVDTAVAAGSFNTLVAAVKAAGLVDTLKGKGPFTVFAPTDKAFAKLPKGTVETLLKPENLSTLR